MGKDAVLKDSKAGCGAEMTSPVGTGSLSGAGPYGHRDLVGNVREYVYDQWSTKFYGFEEATQPDPLNSGNSITRVSRGGGFIDPSWYLRAGRRKQVGVVDAYAMYGVRCVMKLKSAP